MLKEALATDFRNWAANNREDPAKDSRTVRERYWDQSRRRANIERSDPIPELCNYTKNTTDVDKKRRLIFDFMPKLDISQE